MVSIYFFTFTIFLRHAEQTLARTIAPFFSSNTRFFIKFGSNRLKVLIFEWLTLWPTPGLFPHFSQTLDTMEG